MKQRGGKLHHIHSNQLNNHKYRGVGRSSRRLLTENNKLQFFKSPLSVGVSGFSHLSPDQKATISSLSRYRQ